MDSRQFAGSAGFSPQISFGSMLGEKDVASMKLCGIEEYRSRKALDSAALHRGYLAEHAG